MEFCPQCRGRMTLDNKKLQINVCSKCGTKQIFKIDNAIRCLSQPIFDRVVVTNDDDEFVILPTTRAQCAVCGGNRAYYKAMDICDEEETIEVQIFKCTHCMHTWRERG